MSRQLRGRSLYCCFLLSLIITTSLFSQLARLNWYIILSHFHFPTHFLPFCLQVHWSSPVAVSALIWTSALDRLREVSDHMASTGFDVILVTSLFLVQALSHKSAHPLQFCVQQHELVLPNSFEVYLVLPSGSGFLPGLDFLSQGRCISLSDHNSFYYAHLPFSHAL